MEMDVEVLQEANFVQVYMALTLSIVLVHCGLIDELRGVYATWKGSFRYLAEVVTNFIANDDDIDRRVVPDILGHSLQVFKTRLTQPLIKGGYAIRQTRDQHQRFRVPGIPCYRLSSIDRGDVIELPMAIEDKINDKSEVDNAITIVYNDLLTSLKLGSNILSLSQLFLQLSKQFLDPRQARHQIEQHFRLV